MGAGHITGRVSALQSGPIFGDTSPFPVLIVALPISDIEDAAVVVLILILAGAVMVLNDVLLLMPVLESEAMLVENDMFAAIAPAPHTPIHAPIKLLSP